MTHGCIAKIQDQITKMAEIQVNTTKSLKQLTREISRLSNESIELKLLISSLNKTDAHDPLISSPTLSSAEIIQLTSSTKKAVIVQGIDEYQWMIQKCLQIKGYQCKYYAGDDISINDEDGGLKLLVVDSEISHLEEFKSKFFNIPMILLIREKITLSVNNCIALGNCFLLKIPFKREEFDQILSWIDSHTFDNMLLNHSF